MYSIFGFYDELDYLTFCYQVLIIILIGISLLTFFKILWSKIFSSVNINCWFCGKVSKIEKSCSNWWFCLECEQWNGFKEDGDYYQIIPEMYETPVHSVNEANLPNEKSLLCQACLSKQSRKINELAAFVPKDEKHFELESDDFERFLNEKYKPCLSCLSVISYHLQEQDKQIHMTHSQSSSSSSLRKLNMNSTSSSSKSIFKCVVKLMLLLALLWLYRLPTYISAKYLLVYPICFFIYFNILYKTRSFRFKGLVSILGVLLYYFGELKLVTIFVLFSYLIEVISTVWELLKWIFQTKDFYQQKMSFSKVKKLQQNHKIGSFPAEGIVSNGFNRVESFNDIPPQGNSIVTPDLLHGHLDAMQIGNKDSTLGFKGMVNEKNHVMAALKYKDVVNNKKVDSSQRPLLRPATFILQQKKDSSLPDRTLQDDEPFTKIKTNLVLKEKGISSEAVALNKSSISRKKLNWTYFAIGGLVISFLFNIYLISKEF
ncbi:uncharacterized protein LOC101235182 isoform X1 [Hydra vulgaris]|uniref:uncharacterized protein LOC101235182 isoform X1 n=1 Tax=Hydra vulgaris TaxID=6087 RepID=UPI000640F708|nr:uncharacterized protein LOC101235182 [Hydra vulgaris]